MMNQAPANDPFASLVAQSTQGQVMQKPTDPQVQMQQYTMQAQLHQQAFGTPFPYSFHQWQALSTGAKPEQDSFRDLVREQKAHSTNPFDQFS